MVKLWSVERRYPIKKLYDFLRKSRVSKSGTTGTGIILQLPLHNEILTSLWEDSLLTPHCQKSQNQKRKSYMRSRLFQTALMVAFLCPSVVQATCSDEVTKACQALCPAVMPKWYLAGVGCEATGNPYTEVQVTCNCHQPSTTENYKPPHLSALPGVPT